MLHITLWCLTCEFDSIWCTVHPCGGHSGTPDLFKAPDHLSNLQQDGPSKESNVSFLALGQISFRSSVRKHFNPLTWVWCLIRNRQLRRSNQQSAGDYRAVKNVYSRIHFHSVCNLKAADIWPHWPPSDPLSSSFDISVYLMYLHDRVCVFFFLYLPLPPFCCFSAQRPSAGGSAIWSWSCSRSSS